MEIIYLKALLVCLLVILGTSVMIGSPPYEAQHLSDQTLGSKLGFSNESGFNTTQDKINSFINFINSASTFYRNDTRTRLEYISDKMNETYINASHRYSVIQMGNEKNFDWAIWSSTAVWASVAPGVDRTFKQNSYMFLNQIAHDLPRQYISEVGEKGNQIDSTYQSLIKDTILSVQTGTTCSCAGNTLKIKNLLYRQDDHFWNVFCSAQNTFKIALFPGKGKFIYTKPKNCYYLVYAMS